MSAFYREIYGCVLRLTLAEQCARQSIADVRRENIALGQALRACRENKGISLREVARAIGLSAPFLSDCELGRRTLSETKRTAYMKHLRPLLSIQ